MGTPHSPHLAWPSRDGIQPNSVAATVGRSLAGRVGLRRRSRRTGVVQRLHLARCRCGRRASVLVLVPAALRGVSRAPRRSGLCFLPGGLSFSLTQVTFQPFPVPRFAALPSDSADLGVGGQGGRECLPPSQGSRDGHPPSTLCPLPTHLPAAAGAGQASPPVFCGQAGHKPHLPAKG